MNISTDKKTYKIMHTNNNPKKKKQHKQIRKSVAHNKSKNKPTPHHYSRPTRTIKKSVTSSIAIATNQPTLDAAPIILMSTPTSTMSLALPNILFNVTDQDKEQGFISQQNDEELDVNYAVSTAAAAAIHKLEDTQSITQQSPSTVSTTTKMTQIAAPIIGAFGGIALIAAAMFYVVRKRKRNSMLVDNVSKKKHDYDDHKEYYDGEMHDISLLDDENDEAVMVMGPPPKLAPVNTNTTNMSRHIYDNSTIINVPENHPVNNISNMTDRFSEENYTRTNSISPPPLSYRNASSSCRSSTTSTIYTDALMSPTSSIFRGAHLSSVLMIAERQQLQHQKPSILDHFNNNNDILSSKSTPIETYKAQLANLTTMDDDNNDDEQEKEQEKEQEESVLPFFTIVDLADFY
jgi:hypothetical protein